MGSDRPRHRSLRFSLRTLFVLVTLVCIYLGWALNWQRQRQAFLHVRKIEPFEITVFTGVGHKGYFGGVKAPLVLRCFGDEGIRGLSLGVASEEDYQLARSLFPEAELIERAYFTQAPTDDP